jgi:serine/threonine protein kinase
MTGSEIGPYRVLDKLGEGGMGEVYRARDPRLSRDVAIKVLPGSLAGDRDRLRRFEQEARAAGQLNHPNILAVYDAGTHEGAPYLVSELLNGQSLQDVLLSGPLPLRRAVDYARQIAEGLAAAHEKGIVHRDLKPANLFITRDGRIKILDFGIAKLTAAGDDSDGETVVATVTEPGMIVGTPGYMSPEQVRAAHLDGRSDLFNVGAILFEMLTGRAAFRRTTAAETLAAILKDDPLASGGPAGSPSLTRVISRCLEKAPEARFQSARDLSFALEVLSGTSEVAASVTGRSPLRRRALGFIAVALVLALAIVAATWLTRVDEPSIDARWARAVLTPVTNFPGSEADASISPEASSSSSSAIRPASSTCGRRGSAAMISRTSRPTGPDQRNPGNQRSAGFSVDGSEIWLAGGRTTDGLRLVPLLGGPPRVFLHKQAVNVAWSKDGKQLVYFTWEDGDPMTIADATGGNPRLLWVDPKKDHNHFPFLVAGRTMDLLRARQPGRPGVRRVAHRLDGRRARASDVPQQLRALCHGDSIRIRCCTSAPDEDQSGPGSGRSTWTGR